MEQIKLNLSKLLYDAVHVFTKSGFYVLTDTIGSMTITGLFTKKKNKKEQILQIKQWFNDWIDANVN